MFDLSIVLKTRDIEKDFGCSLFIMPSTVFITFILATFAVILFLPRRRTSSICFSSLEKALFHVKASTYSTNTYSNLQIVITLFVFLLVIRVHDIGWSG